MKDQSDLRRVLSILHRGDELPTYARDMGEVVLGHVQCLPTPLDGFSDIGCCRRSLMHGLLREFVRTQDEAFNPRNQEMRPNGRTMLGYKILDDIGGAVHLRSGATPYPSKA